ncbi:MAG: hypothetical protein LC772_07750, partial [Chloroflexi bacterium]|nr:hypothetical protein [Chloroflexota bacterium]
HCTASPIPSSLGTRGGRVNSSNAGYNSSELVAELFAVQQSVRHHRARLKWIEPFATPRKDTENE